MNAAPDWLDELTLKPGPPWLAMGTRGLDDAGWLVVDDRYDEELAEKDRLLAERPTEVFGLADGGADPDGSIRAASVEVLERVTAWLTTHEPDHLDRRRSALERDRPSGPGDRDDRERHPLDDAARLVQEDLCLLAERTDGHVGEGRGVDGSVDGGQGLVLVAAHVCFPSHWRIAEKLGRPMAAVHAPVPHYDVELQAKVDQFLARLRPGRLVQRRNLSIHSHADLFCPEPHESEASYGDDPAATWLRSERQTLLRLPRSGAVLFTIRTQRCPVAALEGRPDVAAALADKLDALGPELRARDDKVPFPAWLVPWLRARPDGVPVDDASPGGSTA